MEGFLPEPVLTFLNSARNLGVSLSWSISSSQEKKSVLLEWNTQPEKCSTGKSGKSQKSPCRRRRDAQRYQVWKEKRERTSDSTHRNPQEGSKGPDKEVQHPESRRSTEAKQKRLRHKKRRRQSPATVDRASPHRDQNVIPAVCTILLEQNRSRSTTETQTDRQVTVSREIQTPQVSADSKYVQTVCLPQSTNSSTQYETLGTTSVPTQTWTLGCNQRTQTVGNGSQKTKFILNPRCLEPSGLEFADRKFIESLNRTRKNPERLPTLHGTGKPTCVKSLIMKTAYGDEIYETHPTLSCYIDYDIDHLSHCLGVEGSGECYLITKYRGKHYILPHDVFYTAFKQLELAGSFCVTLIIYDHERQRYVQPEPCYDYEYVQI